MRSRLVAYFFAFIFIGIIFAPMVSAQDETTARQNINLQPQYADSNSTIVNLMNRSSMKLEKDVVLGELPQIEGKYYGPYLRSSLFQFAHTNGWFQFATNFTISSQEIMNGVSEFWLRVPVIPAQYQWWHIWCSWDTDNIEGAIYPRTPGAWYSDWSSWMYATHWSWNTWALKGTYKTVLPWYDPNLLYVPVPNNGYPMGNLGTDLGNGDIWSIQNHKSYDIKETDNGIYVRYRGIYHPNVPFTIAFTGQLIDGQRPMVFLTQERQNTSIGQSFYFFEPAFIDYATGPVGPTTAYWDVQFKYYYPQTIELDPAWAILFTHGIGKEGMTSWDLHFDGTNKDYLSMGQIKVQGSPFIFNNTFLSLYFPFSLTKDTLTQSGTGINWRVTITIFDNNGTGVDFYDPVHPFTPMDTISFGILNTHNYLLVTAPYAIHAPTNPIWYSTTIYVAITLIPSACDLILLGASEQHPHFNEYFYDVKYAVSYYHEDQLASYKDNYTANDPRLPLYYNVANTDGRWAKVNESKLYWTYDFGWGLAYSFPGETQLYMFLDNGGMLFYTAKYQDFQQWLDKESMDPVSRMIQDLWNKLRDLVGWVWDGIVAVWNTLVSIGNWIYTTISSIVGWIISVIKDIAGKVSNIVEGMLYGVPIMMILFAVTYTGQYLYTGRMPKFSKERRLLRKMRPSAIRAKTRRIERKLKYPVMLREKLHVRERVGHQFKRVQYRYSSEGRISRSNIRTQREERKQLAIRERMDARARRERGKG